MRILLLVVLFASCAIGQSNSDIADWNVAKKLSNRRIPDNLMPPGAPTGDFETMAIGQSGMLDFWRFKVESIVDAKNMILRVGKHTIWLEGYLTDGLVSDQDVRIVDVVQFTKTRSYETVSGASRTVRVFKMQTEEEIKKQEEEEAEKAKRREEALYRTWHSKAGTEVVAKFLSWKNGKIELQIKDGKKILVAIDAFTDDDATELRKLVRESRKKK